MTRERWITVAAVLVALGVGYFVGREHLKYELRSAVESAFTGVGERLGRIGRRPDAVASDPAGRAVESSKAPSSSEDHGEAKEAVAAAEKAAADERARYAREQVELYEVTSGYRDDLLEGKVATVFGKLRNNGDRTLKRVAIVAYFLDSTGKTVFEEDFHPVLVTDFSMGRDNKPLKAGYIKEFGFKAKGVPSEWAEGKARVAVTSVEFE